MNYLNDNKERLIKKLFVIFAGQLRSSSVIVPRTRDPKLRVAVEKKKNAGVAQW